MTQTELLLQLDPDLCTGAVAAAFAPPDARAARLRSVCYDTPDGALGRAGLALRIRTADVPLPAGDSVSDLRLIRAGPLHDGEALLRAWADLHSARLVPVHRGVIERQSWTLREGPHMIAVTLDRSLPGKDGGRVAPYELTLGSASSAALFALARRWSAMVPLRLAVTQHEAGQAVKAGPVALRPDMSAAQAFQVVVHDCLRQFRLNEDLILATTAPEPVHQARVALRRLRAMLSIFAPLWRASETRTMRRRLRALAASLGPVRDLDVLIEGTARGPLRDRLTAERAAARTQLLAHLDLSRELMLDLAEWLDHGCWLTDPATAVARDRPVRAHAADRLARLRRRMRRAGRDLARATDKDRHSLRKEAKALRYGVDAFAALWPGPRRARRQARFVTAIEAVQDSLGTLNDQVTRPATLRRLNLPPDRNATGRRAEKKALIAAAAKAHRGLMDARPPWR